MVNIDGNIECIKIKEIRSRKLLKLNRTHTYSNNVEETFRKQGVVILDDLVTEEDLDELRWYAINTPSDHYFGGGYDSIKGANEHPKYLELSEKFIHSIPILNGNTFDRGWIYVYKNECDGVTPHADPGGISINLWITPTHCIKDWSKNGLIVYNKKRPPDWTWEEYNQDVGKINKYLAESNAIPRLIEYKYNRMVAFDSSYFHKTNGVSTKPGDRNKRINVTWMYNLN